MEEIEKLLRVQIEQIKAMAEAMLMAMQRLEQVFKFNQELSDQLQGLVTRLLTLDEALKKSLSESDQQIDDLATITAFYQKLLEEQQQQQQSE